MSLTPQHATAPEDRVPWAQLIAYGSGGLIPIALFNIAGQLIGLLGNISLGLSAFWLGTIMIVPRLWDAISDPIVGHLSDNTRSRWGRRRLYILVGGLAVAVTFVAMWWIPQGPAVRGIFASELAYNWFQLLFILAGLLLFFTACTIFEIPHGALGMEMSSDYHERTRLFSAKSFFGNLFAMGTPWLLFLAGLEVFRGPGGDLASGMRYVSLFIAALLIPLVLWWFVTLREPGFAIAKGQRTSSFWSDMGVALSNKTFLVLVAIIFTLAMGFNFVALFNYYITIFYLYGGDSVAAGKLLGINGTAWAVTGLIAVFPLNYLSRRLGKSRTLLLAILLMCAAQLAKIVCYNPEFPWLVLIPTILLSAGMLMFFTLGASMVGDVCDQDEFFHGTRHEGTYYSVFWWFIKMGTALASFVTGALLVYTMFDERQNVTADSIRGSVATLQAEAERWLKEDIEIDARLATMNEQLPKLNDNIEKLDTHLHERLEEYPEQASHTRELQVHLEAVRKQSVAINADRQQLASEPSALAERTEKLLGHVAELKRQSPRTLFRLRFVEIGLPLLLSIVSITLTLGYPLTEARCYAIKEALEARRAATVASDSAGSSATRVADDELGR